MIKARIQRERRVCQGDIVANVEFVEEIVTKGDTITIEKVEFPLVIVLTQDCDLAQDYRVRWSRHQTPDDDKMLISALVAPLYNLEHIRAGEHLEALGRKMQSLPSAKVKEIKSNQVPRYHFLEFPNNVPVVPSVVDFKHYFSVNVAYLKRAKQLGFACKVADLFREDISLRFANFLARIGLPELIQASPPVAAG